MILAELPSELLTLLYKDKASTSLADAASLMVILPSVMDVFPTLKLVSALISVAYAVPATAKSEFKDTSPSTQKEASEFPISLLPTRTNPCL